jgi:serine/threonine protein phosphatase PrpC
VRVLSAGGDVTQIRMSEGIVVDAAGATDRGRVRATNEDQFLVAELRKIMEVRETSIPASWRERFDGGAHALLLLVADGVGGRAAGETASGLTLEAIMGYVTSTMRCFYKLDDLLTSDLLRELSAAVAHSHATVRSEAARTPDRRGMATTLTMAHVLWPHAYLAHIGDSRCYHLREATITPATRDQTYVQELVESGALTQEEAARSPLGGVLMQAVGGHQDQIQPAVSQVDLRRGDAIVLCTDGLTAHLGDREILTHVAAAPSAQAAAAALIRTALDRGGTDNVTVIVSRFLGPPVSPPRHR